MPFRNSCRSQPGPGPLGHFALRVLIVARLLFANFLPVVPAKAALLEYEVKAAFLFNFTKFVQWPVTAFESAEAPFTICIVGDDPFGKTLDDIVQGESVNGHRITVQRLQADPQNACHLEYIAKNYSIPANALEAGSGVLTVGEGDDFVRHGGIVGFVVDDRRVRFDINLKAATNAELKLSSKLLAVARSVAK